jgi:hypothetical protein
MDPITRCGHAAIAKRGGHVLGGASDSPLIGDIQEQRSESAARARLQTGTVLAATDTRKHAPAETGEMQMRKPHRPHMTLR